MGVITYLHSWVLIFACFKLCLLLKNALCFLLFIYVFYDGLVADYCLWLSASNTLYVIVITSVELTESYNACTDLPGVAIGWC